MSQTKISPHLVQVGQYAEKASQYGSLVLGGFYQDWALQIINWSTIGYILLGLVLVLVPLKLYLKYRAKQYLQPFSHGLEVVTDGLGNVAIGGLGVAWVKLAVGLYPFFLTAPITIGVVALYFGLVVDVILLKKTVRKAIWINV
jgi:hypothetical protein